MNPKADCLSPEYWLAQWQAYREKRQSIQPKKKAGAQFWGQLACRRSQSESPDRQERTEWTLSFIQRHLPLTPGMRVLDVGAGGGALALPLARLGLEVTAIDLSPQAMDHLRQLAEKEDLPIETYPLDWDPLDLAKRGWEKSFDLVLASMTPAVSSPESFRKLEQASRGSIFYSAFNKPMNIHFQKDLWPAIIGGAVPEANHGCFFLFNWLYSRGIVPNFEENQTAIEEREDAEVLSDHILRYYAMFKDLTEQDQQTIRDYLMSQTQEGQITRRATMKTGFLFWQAP